MKYKIGDSVILLPRQVVRTRITDDGVEEYALAGLLGWHRSDDISGFGGGFSGERAMIWRAKDGRVCCNFIDRHGDHLTSSSDASDFIVAAAQCLDGIIDLRDYLREGAFGRDTEGRIFVVMGGYLIFQSGGRECVRHFGVQSLQAPSGVGIQEIYDRTVTDFAAAEKRDKRHIVWRRRNT